MSSVPGKAMPGATAPRVTDRRLRTLFASLGLVLALWVAIFAWQPLNFWLLMTLAQIALIGVAFAARPDLKRMLRPTSGDLLLGVASALVLYGVFVFGHEVTTRIFPFAEGQVGSIYGLRGQAEAVLLSLLLLFIIGPGEEIYWRGLVQRTLAEHWNPTVGLLATFALYAGAHAVAGNLMLFGAASVAGLFWGLMYWWRRSLAANIVSHAVWDVTVLVLFPII